MSEAPADETHLVYLAASHGVALVTFDRRIAGALTKSDQGYVQVI